MAQIVLVGIGAGLAAALLFASVVSGSIGAAFLFYLAPLPILIAALGWSHVAGLVAGVVAAIGLGSLFGVFFAGAFLVGVALPGWWLGYLALLARPVGNGAGGRLEWYPIGRLVLWAAGFGTLMVAAAIPNFGTDQESFQNGLRDAFSKVIRGSGGEAATRPEVGRVIDAMVVIIPPAAAVVATLTGLFNLWLAGRVVKISGRLRRPWPDLASIALPRFAPGLLAAALAGWFLPGLIGIVSGALSASLLMAFAVLGFAVLHGVTHGMAGRGFVLAGVYGASFIFGWPVLLMAVVGLADSALDLRGRFAKRGGPPNLPTQ